MKPHEVEYGSENIIRRCGVCGRETRHTQTQQKNKVVCGICRTSRAI